MYTMHIGFLSISMILLPWKIVHDKNDKRNFLIPKMKQTTNLMATCQVHEEIEQIEMMIQL